MAGTGGPAWTDRQKGRLASLGPSMGERTRVLYIAGAGRSGSTLLDNILGQVDGYFAVGELRYLWQRGIVENRLCGCSRRFADCPVWTAVLDAAFGDHDGVDSEIMIGHQRRGSRARHLPLLLATRHRPHLLTSRLGGYPDALARLYPAIAEVTASRVIVDSSKLPTYGYLLETIGSLDLYVVHLVRDPRATAYSWTRRKVQPDRGSFGYMESQSPLKSSLLWDLWNVTVEAIWRRFPDRYLRLRYEELVQHPEESVRRVLALLGDEDQELPFADDRTVTLGANHSVAGNPDRLKEGAVTLRADAEWVQRMPARSRALVSAATAPLLLRYGYSLWRPDPGYGEPGGA